MSDLLPGVPPRPKQKPKTKPDPDFLRVQELSLMIVQHNEHLKNIHENRFTDSWYKERVRTHGRKLNKMIAEYKALKEKLKSKEKND